MEIRNPIFIGSDHAGFALKKKIKEYFDNEQIPYQDVGNSVYDIGDDYPDFALAVAKGVVENNSLGILLCHNGVGVCVAANKVKGIRAVNTDSPDIACESKHDDDTNVLCLPGGYIDIEQTIKIITTWLETSFGEDVRYQRRVDKIMEIENI